MKTQHWSCAVAFSLCVAIFLLVAMRMGGAQLDAKLCVSAFLLCYVVLRAGECCLSACGIARLQASLPGAFVVGFVFISLPLVALTVVVNLDIAPAFWVVTLVVLCWAIARGFRHHASTLQREWADVAVGLLCVLLVAVLARTPISAATVLTEAGTLPVWSDYFLHGLFIESLGSPLAQGGDPELVGAGRIFYHYAPYTIPAVLERFSGLNGLQLATAVMLPLGLLVGALGIYAFAAEFGGRFVGLLALAAIVCLPAPEAYWLQSAWFDFYWMLFSSPGTAYALGVGSIVCMLAAMVIGRHDRRLLLLLIFLLASLIMIRVQMFMLLAPPIVLLLIAHYFPSLRRPLWFGSIAVLLGACLLVAFVDPLREQWLHYAQTRHYLAFSGRWSPHFDDWIKPLLNFSVWTYVPAQLALGLLAVLGAYVLIYPFSLWYKIKRDPLELMDLLPVMLIVAFLALTLFAPAAGTGDASEYKHRHFPLLYALVVVFTVCNFFARPPAAPDTGGRSLLKYAALLAAFALVLVLGRDANPARPDVKTMPWAANFFDRPLTPGLLDAARYLKRESLPGDVLTTSKSWESPHPHSALIQSVSLTGLPTFIARPYLKAKRTACVRETAELRAAQLRKLGETKDWPRAKTLLRDNGVRWLLVPDAEEHEWDPSGKQAAFKSGNTLIYDAGRAASPPDTAC